MKEEEEEKNNILCANMTFKFCVCKMPECVNADK